MTLNQRKTHIFFNLGILFLLVASVLMQPVSAYALGGAEGTPALPNFSEFSNSVQNGRADHVRGVYVPNVFALPVTQQPSGNAGFVSSEAGLVTQFRMANSYGNVGLLAHNHLAGQEFFNLQVGDDVRMVNGDGSVEYFVVSEVLSFQALQPYSPYSSFRNLENDQVLTVEQMFKKVYLGDRHVTFQTCIEKDGELSWGRLFVIAIPRSEYEKLLPLYDM